MLVCSILRCTSHARPRVQRAPGLPCALISRARFLQNSGRIAPREREVVSVRHCEEQSDDLSAEAQRAKAETIQLSVMPRNGLLRFARNDESENEQRQLIERIGDFEAHQNQRCDHQIKAEM